MPQDNKILKGLMPKPKRVVTGSGRFIPPATLPLFRRSIPGNPVAITNLRDALQKSLGVLLEDRADAKPTYPSVTLELSGMDAPKERQGYRIRVNATGIRVSGSDTAGVFFGVQTLRQILENAANLAYPGLPDLTVDDWPDFPIRAAHLTLFRYQNQRPNLAFWEALITEVAPAAKLNAIIIQTDWMLRYRRRPEMAQKYALTIEQMQRLARLGRERYIAVIPHLQCLSHQYSLVGFSHPEWLTEPASETYNPDAPGLREALRDLIADLRVAFGDLPAGSPVGKGAPPLHVGLDEVGRLPTRSGETEADTFLRHLGDLDTDARRAGFSSVGFWPDMLPRYDQSGQGRRLLGRIPQGTLFFPWNYEDRKDFTVLPPFKGTTFPLWATGSAKYKQDNLGRLARVARRMGCTALVGSCWNSWDTQLSETVARPLSGLLLAGEFGWNADANVPAETALRSLPYDPIAKIRELVNGLSPVRE